MKKFFYYLASAVVALGAMACNNEIDDNLGGASGESVSITVTLDEATKVALGEVDPEKGQKLVFEENDQLMVNQGSDSTENYYFNYTKAEGEDTYVFTCSTEGVSSLVGHYVYLYYQGGRKDATDTFGNKDDETIKGAFIKGEGTLDEGNTITMKVAPLLKLKSAYPVTITASDWVFNGYSAITTKTTDEWVYISTHTARTVTITATIKGQPAVVKSSGKVTGELELTMEYNKIYNLGELDVMPEESVDGDAAGIEIAIDGVFTDWDSITKNVVTVADDAEYGALKVMKAYTDKDNIYIYTKMESVTGEYAHMSILLDLDNDNTTGGGHWWAGENAYEAYVSNGYLRSNSGSIKTFTAEKYYEWDNESGALVETTPSYTAKVLLTDTIIETEVAFPRTTLDTYITAPNIGVNAFTLTAWGRSGILPAANSTLVIPVHN